MDKKRKAKNKVCPIVGIPLERAISYADEVFWNFVIIAQQGWPFIRLPYTRVDVARNKMADHLLRSEYTHLVMLDLDHAHPANVVGRLCQRASEGHQVVAGLNFRRGKPYEPLAFTLGDDGVCAILNWEQDEMVEVDAVATCAIIIAREVFETIPGPPWFYYDYSVVSEDVYPTEDITFCRLCREHGIKIFVDTGLISPHMITGQINETVFRNYLIRFGQEYFEEVTHGRSEET
jgi:hypothetical protein